MLGLNGLKLDGDLFPGDDVDPKIDVTWSEKRFTLFAIVLYQIEPLDAPKLPEPIFFPRRYFPPTRRSISVATVSESGVVGYCTGTI